MSAPIGPGDYVECIFGQEPLVVGRIYRCEDVIAVPGSYSHCHGRTDAGLIIAGLPVPDGGAYGWCPGCFRPVYRPKTSVIDAMKAPDRVTKPA